MKPRYQDYFFSLPLLFICIAFFLAFPQIDLQISGFFYDASNQKFPAEEWPWVKWLYEYTPEINKWVSVSAAFFLTYAVFSRIAANTSWRRRCIAWLLMVIIGIGFVVDWVLKDHVGRPHPYQTINFNGTVDFVPVLHYRPLCEENCSFVSGHAAGGFVWMAWGMWSRRPLRRSWIWAGLAAGGFIGFARIIQGGHYLSDVVFSGWFIWLVYLLIRNIWLRWRWRKIHFYSVRA